ncbi:hypothetical protein [Arthrobacter sp. TWP1-1]|uniref:hypothetical protein n=1 Tax=Arthrobacter sp. TWP1-1 TaxID=2804568 RepID=UPI003CF386E6
MTTEENTHPIPATRKRVGKKRVAKKTVGTTMAAVTLAAAAVLAGPGLAGASASTLDPASIIGSPPNSASSRIAGVQEDLARAVALHQVTAEQAAFLQRQLVKRIQDDV